MKCTYVARRGAVALALVLGMSSAAARAGESVARQWNEVLLDAIRADFARPTVHARNLFHVSAAMWDSWAAYDRNANTYLHHEKVLLPLAEVEAARAETMSHAVYRILVSRFVKSQPSVRSRRSPRSL